MDAGVRLRRIGLTNGRARLVAVAAVPIVALAATWAVRSRQHGTLVMKIAAAMRPRRVFDAQFSQPITFRTCDRDARPLPVTDDICASRTTETPDSRTFLTAVSQISTALERGV